MNTDNYNVSSCTTATIKLPDYDMDRKIRIHIKKAKNIARDSERTNTIKRPPTREEKILLKANN